MDNIPIRQMVDAGLYGRKSGPQERRRLLSKLSR
jgi:hypothetical protein